ncbi:MAG: hypothetical protein ACRD3E_09600 [Terriglobales bacterium]
MHLAITIGIRILEAVFAAGIVGSAIVVLIVTVQDLIEVFERDVESEREEQAHG